MKKIILIIAILISNFASIGQNCQAFFNHSYDPVNGRLYLNDTSYNANLQPINVVSRSWLVSYGNSTMSYSTQNVIAYTLGYSGPVIVSLTINTSEPCQDNYTDTIYIVSNPPIDTCDIKFHFTLDTSNNSIITLSNSSHTNMGTFNLWKWKVSRNGLLIDSSNLFNPVFALQPTGNYSVCLTASSTGGCNNTHCENFILPDTCYTNYTYYIDTIQGNYTFHFSDASFSNLGTINYWYWFVTKNGSYYAYSGAQNPSFTFAPGNTYVVKLTTQSTGCNSSHSELFSFPNLCIANYSYSIDSVANPVQAQFTDISTIATGNIVSWNWTVQHNGSVITSSTLQNPLFSFPSSGYYNVCLQITTSNSCSNSFCSNIWIPSAIPCQLTVTSVINNVTTINGNDGSIDISVSGGTPPYTYLWSNGATTQDISNLSCGLYDVTINSAPVCPALTYYFEIEQPYNNPIIDTLTTITIDTCFGFLPDSVVINSYTLNGNMVTVLWDFYVQGTVYSLSANYNNVLSNGSYALVITIYCPTGFKTMMSYMSYITINNFSEIEIATEDDFKIFPNPVDDWLNIFAIDNKKFKQIQLYDMDGKLIISNVYPEETTNATINTSQLSHGAYLLKIIGTENVLVNRQIIK